MIPTTRHQRRQLKRDNRSWPERLTAVPRDLWPNLADPRRIRVLRSRHYLVQEFLEPDGQVRLSICGTVMRADGRWEDGLTWDELQTIKRECGYAYRNGERVEDRSDATITPEGDTFGTPGCWPGFAMIAQGVPHDEVQKRIEWPSGHAVLGDGPVYLVLRKTYATLYRGPERFNMPIGRDDYDADEVRCTVELDGCKVELIYTREDNYYVYARLTQPDSNVWHGWSGYGVGAGLEDAGYGYSTSEREDKLWELFGNPKAPQEVDDDEQK